MLHAQRWIRYDICTLACLNGNTAERGWRSHNISVKHSLNLAWSWATSMPIPFLLSDRSRTHTNSLGRICRTRIRTIPEYGNMRGEQFDYSVLSKFLPSVFADPVKMFVPQNNGCRILLQISLWMAMGRSALKNALSKRLNLYTWLPALAPRCIVDAAVHTGKRAEAISDHYPVSIRMELPQVRYPHWPPLICRGGCGSSDHYWEHV